MLEKIMMNDKIEIYGDFDTITVRCRTIVKDDGEVISETFKRCTIEAGETFMDDCPKVKAVIAAVHTPEIIAARKAKVEDDIKIPMEERRRSPAQLAKKAEIRAARKAARKAARQG